MNLKIRTELEDDFGAVFELIKSAFEKEEFSDHKEHYLVERLRKSDAFIPALSLVAEMNGQIVGYILLSKVAIVDAGGNSHTSLSLAPVAVLPKFQGKGIGGRLIEASHERAKELDFNSVVVLGHEDYYPRFGYMLMKQFGIALPFNAPEANCMVIELIENALQNINGVVAYPKEFEI
ncbi:GNAT family N-acetyltransferase [Chryseobacterium sp. NKUCC03_KSP]|uniref:GNAT family N-acetyltransferase n=1 Tax=Chryseobacterium sp. NKUCC03_KSP TaxID=2842125 RepID=UPI001C5B0B29|nr:N-acetyltransferase [Chryseobacterium sp. NKUCC03_KSP]MBW3524806.1 N-acetyltransferase [Chryseobacterium sp. NKUCC03_KSP]